MALEFNAKGGVLTPHVIVSGDNKAAIEFKNANKSDFTVTNTVIDNNKVLDVSVSDITAPSILLTAGGVGCNMASMNGNNIAVLNNAAGKVYYSTNNGQTFTPYNLPDNMGTWGDIEYFNGRYIISGEKGVRTTTDFVTWTAPAFPGLVGTPPCWTLSVANNTLFVSFNNSFIYRSTDGITFTGGQRQPTSQYINFYKVIHDGSKYVGAGNIANPQVTYSSTDGATWTPNGTAPENVKVLNGIAFYTVNSLYYTITETGNTYSSSNLTTWTRVNDIPNSIGMNVSVNSGVLMVTTTNGNVYYTYDGSTWNTIKLSSTNVFGVMAYGSEFVAATGTDIVRFNISPVGSSLLRIGKSGITTEQPQSLFANALTRKDYVDGKIAGIPDAYTSLKTDGYTGTKVQLKDSLNSIIGIQPNRFLDAFSGGEIYKPVYYRSTVFTSDDQLVNVGYVKQQTVTPAALTTAIDDAKTTADATYVKLTGSTMTGDLKMEGLASVRFVNGASTAFTVDQFVDGSGMTNFEISAGATGATSTVVTTTAPSYGGIAYNNGVSVSASTGIVTVSVDGGNTWQRSAFSDFVVSGFSPNMVSVANNRFFIGSSTSLYTSVDGSSWTKCAVASEQYFAVVYVGSQYIAGTANGVVRSTDALTWTKVTVSTSPYRHYYAVASSGNLAVISGLGAACFTSTDGTTWVQKPNIPSSADIMRLDYVNNTWFALARDRTVYRSTDNAGTWKKLTVPTTLTGQGHALVATPDYVIVGYGPDATFFTSTDNGDTWKSSKLVDTSYIISVAPIDATSVMFVTQQGNVHKTSLGKTGTVPFRANVDGVFTDVAQNTANNALVRKDYVDTLNSIGVKRTGDVMTGALTITTPYDSPLILNNTDDGPFYITFRRNDENRFFLRHQKAATMEEDSLEMVSAAKTGDNYIIPLKVTGSGVYSGVPTANSSIALTRKDYVDGRLGEKINRIGDTMTGQLTLRYNAPVLAFVETDNADKKWAFAADGGTFRIHEDTTGITDPEVVLMVTLDKKTAIRNPTARGTQGTTADSLTRKDYVDGKVAKSGDTMTGTLVVNVPNAFNLQTGQPSIDLKNGRMVGINQLLFNDESDVSNEGILFPKTGKSASTVEADYDIIRALDGKLLFNGKEAYGAWNIPDALTVGASDLKYGIGASQAFSVVDMDSDPKTWNGGKMGIIRAISTTANKPEGLTGEGLLTRYQNEDDVSSFKLMFMAGNNTYRRLYLPNTGWSKWTKLAGFTDGVMSVPVGDTQGFEFGNVLSADQMTSKTYGDSATITYQGNYLSTNTDFLVFTKYDGNDLAPDGGFAFNWKSRTLSTQNPPDTEFSGEYLRMNRDTVTIPAFLDITSNRQTNAQFTNLGDQKTSSDTVLRLVHNGNVVNDSSVFRTFIKPTITEIGALRPYHAQFFTGASSLDGQGTVQQVFSVDYKGVVDTLGTFTIKGKEVYHEGNKPTLSDFGGLPTTGGMMTGPINFALPGTTSTYGIISAQSAPNRLQMTGVANVLIQADNDNKNANETLTLAAGLNQLIIGSGAAAKTNSIAYNGFNLYHEGNKPTWLDVKAVGDYQEVLTADLNTVIGQGVYFQDADVNATDAKHYPITQAGTLFVTRSVYGAQQEYTTHTGRKFQRGLTNNWNGKDGPWGPWTEFWSGDTPEEFVPFVSKSGATMTGSLSIAHAAPQIIFHETEANKKYIFVSDGTEVRLNEDKTDGRLIWQYQPAFDAIRLYKPEAGVDGMGSKPTSLATKAYADAIDAKNVAKAGDTMTGNLTFSNDSMIQWSRNTDYASISFKNASDSDTDSYMHFKTGDNGNEYFKWSLVESATTPITHNPMNLKKDGLYVNKLDAEVVRQNGVNLDCNIQNLNVGGVATNITTAQFIDLLKAQGAFVNRHWIGKTFWTYAANATITDTGVGNLNLTGCVIEVFSQSIPSAGNDASYIIRVTTPTTAPSATPSSQFTYVNHGPSYSPGWRRDYNTANPPPAGTGSDIKLKKDITPITNALEKVNALNGVEYNLKKDNTHHCGFIAQDVEKVIPEAVHVSDDGESKLVEYGNMVAYMAEAIKELTSQVKQLQAEVQQLRNQ